MHVPKFAQIRVHSPPSPAELQRHRVSVWCRFRMWWRDVIYLRRLESICKPNFNEIPTPRLLYMYFRFRKQTAAILECYFRFRFWPICRHRHVILHRPTKFKRNGTMWDEVLTSFDFSTWLPQSRNLLLASFLVTGGTCLKRSNAICSPNFNEISLSTAEILLLPVSETNYIVIGMSFCFGLPDFLQNKPPAAKLWHHIDFQDGGRRVVNLLPASGLIMALV